jgi:DNA-binding transcriptional LysR family regulator
VDLKDLRYAIAVAEEGSFTRAAARLHLAQQALSKQIIDLERELNVRLFVRGARGTRLTSAGAAFMEDARTTLAQSQRAMARARSTERREAQLIRVGLTPSSTLAEAAAAPLRRVHQHNPLLQLDVLQMTRLELRSALRDGSLDLAVVCSPPDDSGAIAGECVWERPLGAVLPATHPLAAQDAFRVRELVDLPLITFGRDTDPLVYDTLLGALAHRGLRPRLADVRADGPPGLIGPFVAAGEGWTLATEEDSWPLYERISGLVFRHFADSPILAQRWVLWLSDAPSPLIHQFIAAWDGRGPDGVTASAPERG